MGGGEVLWRCAGRASEFRRRWVLNTSKPCPGFQMFTFLQSWPTEYQLASKENPGTWKIGLTVSIKMTCLMSSVTEPRRERWGVSLARTRLGVYSLLCRALPLSLILTSYPKVWNEDGHFFFRNLAAKKEKVRALTRFSRSGSCAIKGENLAGEKAGKTLVLLMSRGHDRCPYAFKVPGSPPWCEDTNYGVGKFPVLGLAALLLGHLTACLYFSRLSRGSVFQTSASTPLQHSLAFVLGVCLILSHRMEDCLL